VAAMVPAAMLAATVKNIGPADAKVGCRHRSIATGLKLHPKRSLVD
jgi:hypothetical protein